MYLSTMNSSNFNRYSQDAVAQEYRIVLIGKTGAGKSSTANTLIGEYVCESKLAGSSVTSLCQKVEGFRNGKKLVLVDTPGLFDTNMSKEESTKEIMKCIGISSPGPHAVVLVVGIKRLSQEEANTVDHFLTYFGESVLKYMIVLFTRMDDLCHENTTLDSYIQNVPYSFRDVLGKCENRYLGFNNRATGLENNTQVNSFFGLVESTVDDNGGSYYSNEMLQSVEEELQKRMFERQNSPQWADEFRLLLKQNKEQLTYLSQQQQNLQNQIRYRDYEARLVSETLRQKERDDLAKGENNVLLAVWNGFKKGCAIIGKLIAPLVIGLFSL